MVDCFSCRTEPIVKKFQLKNQSRLVVSSQILTAWYQALRLEMFVRTRSLAASMAAIKHFYFKDIIQLILQPLRTWT
ncbi:hypothetical protein ILYODFUR_011629 [Ilyodon furcidens]|uniref:Uncharacterized protein n=1 Tax=Ilyodon furcidens TaxID=33524 RepID=A0ABV0USX4_9TELE